MTLLDKMYKLIDVTHKYRGENNVPRKPQTVTDAELAVMKVLWEDTALPVRAIAERIYPKCAESEVGTVHSLLQRLERKVIAETAQARASAFYMAMVPAVVLAVYYFVLDRDNTERLFTTVPGQIILCVSLILNVIAYLWARVILNPDI